MRGQGPACLEAISKWQRRLDFMTTHSPIPVALAWFRAEDYQRIREICADEMMPTFADFEAKMAKAIPQFEAKGIRLEKVIVNPDALLAFAKATKSGPF